MRLMMKCPNCEQEATSTKSIIRDNEILSGCVICLSSLVQGNILSAKYNRDRMREDHRKDIVQKSDPRDYAKAYPKQAREFYGDEEFRKLA